MPGLRRMPKRNPRLAGLRRYQAGSCRASSTVPAAVKAWVCEEPLAGVPESLHGGPPSGVDRSVVPCVASAAGPPARIVDAAGAIDLIDRRLVRYVKARTRGVSGEGGDRNNSATFVVYGDRCRDVPLCIVAHKPADAIIE